VVSWTHLRVDATRDFLVVVAPHLHVIEPASAVLFGP
jgi:hypothetical protein